MELSLDELKTQLIQDICTNYTASVQGCTTKEELKVCSKDVIKKITEKVLLGEQAEIGPAGQP